jgi:hypothetical protein
MHDEGPQISSGPTAARYKRRARRGSPLFLGSARSALSDWRNPSIWRRSSSASTSKCARATNPADSLSPARVRATLRPSAVRLETASGTVPAYTLLMPSPSAHLFYTGRVTEPPLAGVIPEQTSGTAAIEGSRHRASPHRDGRVGLRLVPWPLRPWVTHRAIQPTRASFSAPFACA